MLKNIIATLLIAAALWSNPFFFTVFDTSSFDRGGVLNIAHAQLSDGDTGFGDDGGMISDGPPLVRPATPLPEDPLKVFGLKCSILSGKGIVDCIVVVSFYVFTAPTGLVLFLAGGIFDALLALSLSPLLLNQGFVATSWETIRNLVNLLFILVLLWISIATILHVGGIQLKQAVANIIIIALLVNFSFFFTRVIIDASNVVAMEFYNRAGVGASSAVHVRGVPEKRISDKIINSFNPQALMSPDAFQKWKNATNSSNAALIFLFFLIGIINLIVAYVLFYAGFLMLGRVIAFIFLIIASPLAFISYALPKGGGFTSSWWNQLLSQAMVAPVFLFFLYIIVQMLSNMGNMIPFSGGSAATGTSFADFFTTVTIKTAIVVVALMIALSKTKSLSGAAGTWATKAGTTVFGAAVATTAFAGRHTIGRAAQAFRDSNTGKQLIARTGVAGEYLDRGLGATASGTMDLRGLPGGKSLGLGGVSYGKGGYKKSLDEQIKRKVDLGKRLGTDKQGGHIHELARQQVTISHLEKDEKGRDVWKTIDVQKGQAIPKTFTDESGNIRLVKKDGKIQYRTATDTYTDNLAKERKTYFLKKSGYKQASADRAAAVALRKKETAKDKLEKAAKEILKEDESATPKETAPKEADGEKPKET